MKNKSQLFLAVQTSLLLILFGCTPASSPDLILFNGKIITVDITLSKGGDTRFTPKRYKESDKQLK